MVRKLLALAVLVIALGATQAKAYEPEVLKFGIISTESTQNLRSQWQPFLDRMEAALGMPVQAFFAPDYAGVIEGMRFKKVDVAWFGNKSAMEAVDRSNAEIFVQTSGLSEDGEIEYGYYSLLVTHKDSDLHTLEDVLDCDAGLNFGNGDPNSTSGFLVPSFYVFAQNDVNPNECYANVRTANHETNLIAAATRQVDFATNNTENLGRFAKTRPDLVQNIRIIWQSPLIPKDPITYRADLDKELKNRIKAFFLSFGRYGDNAEEEQRLLVEEGLVGDRSWLFFDSNNSQLYPIRQLQLFRNKLRIQNDDTLSDDEKAERIAEIDQQLADLKVLANSPMGVH